jgi:ABC-type multidrug transport system ATPase subunit
MLNVLTRRNLSEVRVDGKVLINGEPITEQQMRLCSAYVQQDDLFIPTLTVLEHLQFNVSVCRVSDTHTCVTGYAAYG